MVSQGCLLGKIVQNSQLKYSKHHVTFEKFTDSLYGSKFIATRSKSNINSTKTVFMYCKYYLGVSFKRLNKKDNKKE